ncbi:hypothetical protein B0H14DRAFT_3869090 [Mycena olivaceomarginata]|nr:hypothetical protein B0H14DRAFT_3869090 [Mycena olivaceomarginata]
MYTAPLAPHRSPRGSNVKEQSSPPTAGFTSSGALDASIFNGSTHPQCKNQRATPSLAIPPFDPHHRRAPKSTRPSFLSQQSNFQRTAIVLSTLPPPDRVLPFRVRQQSECATAAPNVRPQRRTARIPSVNSAVKQTTRAVPTPLTASQLLQMLPMAIPLPSRVRQLSSLYLAYLRHPPPLPQLQRSRSTALSPPTSTLPPKIYSKPMDPAWEAQYKAGLAVQQRKKEEEEGKRAEARRLQNEVQICFFSQDDEDPDLLREQDLPSLPYFNLSKSLTLLRKMKLAADDEIGLYDFAMGLWRREDVDTTFRIVPGQALLVRRAGVVRCASFDRILAAHAPARKSGNATYNWERPPPSTQP